MRKAINRYKIGKAVETGFWLFLKYDGWNLMDLMYEKSKNIWETQIIKDKYTITVKVRKHD